MTGTTINLEGGQIMSSTSVVLLIYSYPLGYTADIAMTILSCD